MRRIFRAFLKGLLVLAIIIGLGIFILPKMLDRNYYSGPKSAHFDGEHFFNPDGDDELGAPKGGGRTLRLWRFITGSSPRAAWPETVRVTPTKPPARVNGKKMIVTWVGHATVLVQTEGLNILTDPIWSDTAGPFGIGPHRVAVPGVRFEDLPPINVVLVSHNHYDHLDVSTLQRLQARDHPRIFTGLGNDTLLAREGVKAQAMDWGQRTSITPDVSVVSSRNHHWGGRWGADAKRALWTAFVVTTPHGNLFFAGDTGAGDMQWPTEARRYGAIRLALIPIGAFRFAPGQMANGSHIGPIDAVRVFEGLGADQAIAMHWGTFHLSSEAYDTPPKMLREVMKCHGLDADRFKAVGFGQPVEVGLMRSYVPVTSPALNDCLSGLAIRGLQ